MNLVGKKFPNIKVKAIDYLGDESKISLVDIAKKQGKKILLLWYPKDFTTICPTELIALQESIDEIEQKRNVLIFGASCDTTDVHFAWLNTDKDDGGIKGVEYPLISDTKRELAELLDICDDEDNVSYRATYLINEDGTVFHQSVNHMYIGRKVDDMIRLIDAQIFNDTKGGMCPANWEKENV